VEKMVAITKPVAKARLGDVPEEKRFWVADGRYLTNLEELKAALEGMTDETFLAHSNESKSDFSVWVNEVIGDDKLASDLKKSATRLWAAKCVADRIKFLKSKTGA
jgi:SpoU rRNA methylase family enzyme